ncbi:hypothetical protein TRVA0_010S01134 [Trichomonascus vanleenenianus]|uniref:Vam6p n=1 Tax=Trichomonascus vanleenenianus TaxID=2268995 RepID=UPI003ECA73C9
MKVFSATPVWSSGGSNRKITAIFGYGDKLLVGFADGAFDIHTVSDPFSPDLQASLLKTCNGFSKKSIDQIGLVKNAGGLVVLTDSVVHIFDMDTFNLVEKLHATKQATQFAAYEGIVDVHGIPTVVNVLAVACRRKLVWYVWSDSEFVRHRDVQLADRIRAIAFLDQNKVVCGLAGDFVVVDLNSGEVVNTIPMPTDSGLSYWYSYGGGQNNPLALHLPPNFLSSESQPQAKVSALVSKGLTTRYLDPSGNVQIHEPMDWSVPPSFLGYSYPYLLGIIGDKIEVRNLETNFLLQEIEFSGVRFINNGKLLYAASSTEIVRYLVSDYVDQVRELAGENKIGEAISLLNQIEPVLISDKESMLRDLLKMNATKMFNEEHKYAEALLVFSDISAPPQDVIDLFPEEISGYLHKQQQKASPESEQHKQTDLGPGKQQVGSESDKHVEPTKEEGESQQAEAEEQHGEEQQQQQQQQQQEEEEEEEEEEDEEASASKNDTHADSKVDNSIVPKEDLITAVKALQPYLADTRRKIATLMTKSGEKIKFQGFELSEEIYGNLNDAAALVDTTLFQCYLLTSPSLIGSLVRVANNCDVEIVEKKLKELGKSRELIDFYFSKGMHSEALKELEKIAKEQDSPQLLVNYLEKLNDASIDLIIQYAFWPISVDKEYAYDLFFNDTLTSHQKIFPFLKELDDSTLELPIKYLERVLSSDVYIQTSADYDNLALAYTKSIERGDKLGLWCTYIEFLETNDKLRPSRLISQIPYRRQFFQPHAILYGKKGNHHKALEIYAFELGDNTMAKGYCARQFDRDPETGVKCLHILFDLYLSKGDGYTIELLQLLKSQGSRMSAINVIEKLPPSIQIDQISQFLQSQLRSLQSELKTGQMEAAARKVNLVKTHEQLLELHQRHALVTNLKTCRVCMKRLGHSVISMFPDGSVVHYGCSKLYKDKLKDQQSSMRAISVGEHNEHK